MYSMGERELHNETLDCCNGPYVLRLPIDLELWSINANHPLHWQVTLCCSRRLRRARKIFQAKAIGTLGELLIAHTVSITCPIAAHCDLRISVWKELARQTHKIFHESDNQRPVGNDWSTHNGSGRLDLTPGIFQAHSTCVVLVHQMAEHFIKDLRVISPSSSSSIATTRMAPATQTL